jgi:hypothetical protein
MCICVSRRLVPSRWSLFLPIQWIGALLEQSLTVALFPVSLSPRNCLVHGRFENNHIMHDTSTGKDTSRLYRPRLSEASSELTNPVSVITRPAGFHIATRRVLMTNHLFSMQERAQKWFQKFKNQLHIRIGIVATVQGRASHDKREEPPGTLMPNRQWPLTRTSSHISRKEVLD